jgi:hypothetical protein
MINQIRTLLLNIDGSNNPGPNYPGEEYVPPTFHAFQLTGAVRIVHQLMFGIAPDRALMNYRLRELLTVVHTGPMAQYVYALDPRVTYWPPQNNSLFQSIVAGVQVGNLNGTTAQLSIVGAAGLVYDNETLVHNYLVQVVDSSHVSINNVSYTYTTTDGLAGPIFFPGTGKAFVFNPVVGSQWSVSWVGIPSRRMEDVFRDLQLAVTGDLVTALFQTNLGQPNLTFFNEWDANPYLPNRMAGITLALGYAMSQALGN